LLYRHRGLTLRLAEHWAEFRDWRSVRDLLQQVPANEMTAETIYLRGRSRLSLLLENELDDTLAILSWFPAALGYLTRQNGTLRSYGLGAGALEVW